VPGDFRGYVTDYSKGYDKNKNKLTWAVLKAKTSNTNGTVKLKSTDPTDTPDINFNYFTDGREDLEAVLEGVDFVRNINKRSPLATMTQKEVWPGKMSKPDLRSFVSREAWGHHASCTCPMGRYATDSVVNFDFKVHGTNNLRIVDASVFPKIPGHFIVTPIYMIAEKAADVIKKDNWI
jgi:choline dehydrogenase